MPRKVLTIFIVVFASIWLSGCSVSVSLKDDIQEKVDKVTGDVTEKANEIKDEFQEAKEKVENKIGEVENAIGAVNEVFDADEEDETSTKDPSQDEEETDTGATEE